MAIKNYFIPFCISMLCYGVKSQPNEVAIDSLKGKTYDYFLQKLEVSNQKEAHAYAAAYLSRAKSQNNWVQIAKAYKIVLHQAEKHVRIYYADSLIDAAKHTHDDEIIGASYLTKGTVYYDLKNYNSALDNYLVADSYLVSTNDKYLIYKTKYSIALIKYYLGFYDEASALFSDCITYFKDGDDIPYITSLHSLSMCYIRLGKLDLCSANNELGIKEAERLEFYEAIPRFVNSEGINQYYKKNYNISISKLNETLPSLKKNKDFANETVTYFYLGKNYWALKQPGKALPYLLKVDEAFANGIYLHPDLRENYELLINYYKTNGDFSNQLKYIDQLFLADKFLDSNYKYLSSRIQKEYDTKQLRQAKIEAENSLGLRGRLITFSVILIIILATALFIAIHKINENNRRYKKLMDRSTTQKVNPDKKVSQDGSLDINPDVIAHVLKHIENFEKKEKYRSSDVTLPKVAKMFDSNIVYVSKIIAFHRQKKFIDYINDLRIEYTIKQLQSNSKFRNYTNKALGEEARFSTTQHFTRAFVKNTGISPTFFVKKLNKEIAAGKIS